VNNIPKIPNFCARAFHDALEFAKDLPPLLKYGALFAILVLIGVVSIVLFSDPNIYQTIIVCVALFVAACVIIVVAIIYGQQRPLQGDKGSVETGLQAKVEKGESYERAQRSDSDNSIP